MNAIDWDTAPTWALWRATDRSGDRHYYSNKPYRGLTIWNSSGGTYEFGGEDRNNAKNWRDTLEPRP